MKVTHTHQHTKDGRQWITIRIKGPKSLLATVKHAGINPFYFGGEVIGQCSVADKDRTLANLRRLVGGEQGRLV